MDNIKIVNINYNNFINRNYLEFGDEYDLISFINNEIHTSLLQCPNNFDPTKTAMILALDGNTVVGRTLLYGTKIKIGNSFIYSQSMGSVEIYKKYRGKGIASKMVDYMINNDEYPFFLFSLISPSCYSIMRKCKDCIIFDFPEYIKIINTEAAFAIRGIKGTPLKILKNIGNFLVNILDIPNKIRIKKLKKIYNIKQESIVPEWAEEMCLNSKHKYAEYHDKEWLQWNLNNNLSGDKDDKQFFYSIYKENTPVGFFITKERRRYDITKCKMINGTICEWASIDNNLNESDINLLALSTFHKNIYRVLSITDNKNTERSLKLMGFIKVGYMQMGFKDKLKQLNDINDIKHWRIRFGCCNSILY